MLLKRARASTGVTAMAKPWNVKMSPTTSDGIYHRQAETETCATVSSGATLFR